MHELSPFMSVASLHIRTYQMQRDSVIEMFQKKESKKKRKDYFPWPYWQCNGNPSVVKQQLVPSIGPCGLIYTSKTHEEWHAAALTSLIGRWGERRKTESKAWTYKDQSQKGDKPIDYLSRHSKFLSYRMQSMQTSGGSLIFGKK